MGTRGSVVMGGAEGRRASASLVDVLGARDVHRPRPAGEVDAEIYGVLRAHAGESDVCAQKLARPSGFEVAVKLERNVIAAVVGHHEVVHV
jgi:hypothetical protein